MAKAMSSFRLKGSPKRALTPTTAPAELAALLPIPLPAFIPFMISISKNQKGYLLFQGVLQRQLPPHFLWWLKAGLAPQFG